MVDGTSSCVPARCSRALPLDGHRDGVERQCRTASCHPRSAACGWASCVQAGWASGVSITCFVEEACWSSMPSTTRMVSKDPITCGQQWVPSVPTLQRRRRMGRWRRTDKGTLRRQAELARNLRLLDRTHGEGLCAIHTCPLRRRRRLAMYPHSSRSRILNLL